MKEGRKSRFQKMFWLGRLIRSVTNSRRKRNYKKSKDLIERKTKQKKDKKKKIIPLYVLLRFSGVQLKGLEPRIFQTTLFGVESNEMYDIQNGST